MTALGYVVGVEPQLREPRHRDVPHPSIRACNRWLEGSGLHSKDMWRFGAPPATPSELFRRHVWVSPFYEDDVPAFARLIGADHVLAGSDSPHPEGLASPVEFADEPVGLDAAALRAIMRDNSERLVGAAPVATPRSVG